MPNPILRVGPFIKNNVFVDQPSDLSAPNDAIPINCANTTSSSNWPWRYEERIFKSINTHTGCDDDGFPTTGGSTTDTKNIITATGNFSKSESVASNRVSSLIMSFEFFYQAAQSFQIKVDFTASASASSGLPAGSSLFAAGSMEFEDSQTSSPTAAFPNLSGSVTRTLPAAVVPAQYFCQLKSDGGLGFPTDVCTPNSGTVTATGSLSFEFL